MARARPGRRARSPCHSPGVTRGCHGIDRYGGEMEPDLPHPEREAAPDSSADEADDVRQPRAAEPRRRPRRLRRFLATLGVVVLALCAIGGAAGYLWYDRKFKIERGTPAVVVFQYVDALFDARDLTRAKLFECSNGSARRPLLELRSEVEERERRFDIRITVTTSGLSTNEFGTSSEVRGNLVIAAPEKNGDVSRLSQPWVFELRDEDGWRVCAARRES